MRTTPIAFALLLGALAAGPAMAADTGQIAAEVTPAAPCVTVGDNLNYGVAPFSTLAAAVSRNASTSFTNCSVQAEQIFVRGTEATSASSDATWGLTGALPCQIDTDFYALGVADGSTGLNLSTTDQRLSSSMAAETTKTLTTTFNMPCSGSAGMGEKMTFSIIITASF
jgi:hypothetical protein